MRVILFFATAVLLVGALAPGCGSQRPGGPGSDGPGQSCSEAADCGCWSCTCKGIGGAPGGAQLCVAGTCPTGQDACETVCKIADAPVASATSVEHCPAVP